MAEAIHEGICLRKLGYGMSFVDESKPLILYTNSNNAERLSTTFSHMLLRKAFHISCFLLQEIRPATMT